MTTARATLHGTFWVALAQALMLPTGLATVVFLTRKLGPPDYGSYALAVAIIVFVEATFAQAFNSTTAKLVSEDAGSGRVATKLVQTSIAIGVAATAAFWIAAAPLAEMLGDPALAGYIRLAAVDIPIQLAASAHLHVLVGLGRFRQRSFAGAARWIVRLALIVLLVQLGLGIEGAILGVIGASIAEIVVCRRFHQPRIFVRTGHSARRLWRYATPLLGASLVLHLLQNLDLFLLRPLGATSAEVGNYAAALTLGIIPLAMAGSVAPLLVSSVAGCLSRGDEPGARYLADRILRLVLLLVPFAALASGSARELAPLLIGADFPLTGAILSVLIFANLGHVLLVTCTALLTAAGRPAAVFRFVAPLAPVAVVAYLLVIPRFGPLGAAAVSTGVVFLGVVPAWLAVARRFGGRGHLTSLLKSGAVALVAFAIAVTWPTPGALVVVKLLVVSALLGMAFLISGELDDGERTLLRSLVRWRPTSTGGTRGTP